jgi:hypothetical protein
MSIDSHPDVYVALTPATVLDLNDKHSCMVTLWRMDLQEKEIARLLPLIANGWRDGLKGQLLTCL